MLPKKERLSTKEFSRFFSVGKKTHTPLFTMVYHPHQTLHVSVVVPKKVERTAVRRNKIRRQIYDMVRRYRAEHKTTGVFIFVVKKQLTQTPRDEIVSALHEVIHNIQKP